MKVHHITGMLLAAALAAMPMTTGMTAAANGTILLEPTEPDHSEAPAAEDGAILVEPTNPTDPSESEEPTEPDAPDVPELGEGETALFRYTNYGDHIVLNKLKYSGQKKITIPSEIGGIPVTEIGSMCCYGPIFVEEWVIPEGVRTIGSSAFGNCMNVERIVLPSTVEEIGSRVFATCGKLTEVVWNGCTPRFGYGIFANCSAIERIEIPEGTEELGSGMFFGCTALTEVTLPESLRNIRFDSDSMDFLMGQTAWYEAQPDGIVYLGDFAIGYKGDNNVTTLSLREGTVGIAEGAFRYLASLETIEIPDCVRFIGENAFPRLDKVTDIRLPRNLERIGLRAFSRLPNVTAFTIAEDAPNFAVVDGILYSRDLRELASVPTGVEKVVLPETVERIPAGAFANCWELREISIPEGITEIPERAFILCMKLERVELPQSLKRIGVCAFSNSGIRHITLPEGLEEIGEAAFSQCDSLQEIIMPDSVTSLGRMAFQHCTSLRKVRLPAGVTRIESEEIHVVFDVDPSYTGDFVGCMVAYEGVFTGCNAIETLIFPRELTYVGMETFGKAQIRDTWYSGTQAEWEAADIVDRQAYGTVHFGYDESSEVSGDATLDGALTVLDAVYLQRYLHGEISLNAAAFRNVDINKDGEVDIFDLSLLKMGLLGTGCDKVQYENGTGV